MDYDEGRAAFFGEFTCQESILAKTVRSLSKTTGRHIYQAYLERIDR